jgi:arylsulfatase A-like enzyme
MVVVDALRRDHLGSYGYHLPTSPFIDSLAQRGVRVDNGEITRQLEALGYVEAGT